MTATKTWTKLSRKYGWDRNPLRRRSDLIAAWLLPAAVAVFLILGTLGVLVVGAVLRADNAAAWRHADKYWKSAHGVLLQSAPGPAQADNGANEWSVPTKATWVFDGVRHIGTIPAIAGSTVNTPVTVWLDHKGHVQTPPLTPTQLGGRILETRVVILALLALAMSFGTGAAYGALNRRRVNSWEAEWMAVEPRWSDKA
jgi:hypothetical protein